MTTCRTVDNDKDKSFVNTSSASTIPRKVNFVEDKHEKSGLVRELKPSRSTRKPMSASKNGSGAAVFSLVRTASDRQRAVLSVQEGNNHFIPVIFPWSRRYNVWWAFTVFAAVVTIFFSTYQIGFSPAGVYPSNDPASILEYILILIFVVDMALYFNLAFDNGKGEIVYDRKEIAIHYLRGPFWIDLLGVFPFYAFALAVTGELGEDTSLSQYLGLLRLLHVVRLRRVQTLLENLQYSTKISLLTLTLARNFAAALVWTHFAACSMYFISRQYGFSEDKTWIGGLIADLNGFERYLTSLYWSIVTFTTVGYGDFSPVNSAEQVWGMIYMLLNIILHSWIIGSITLLIVKHDEKTGDYRDTLQTLDLYSTMHDFEQTFHKRLKTQLKLDFNNKEIADEQVLNNFPSSVRRKVLRKLYLPSLIQTSLMKGIRQQFVDAFLTTCNVEIFSPGEEILQRGSIASDLYLLVGGLVELLPTNNTTLPETSERGGGGYGSIADSEYSPEAGAATKKLGAGEFINEIGFFTESPQVETVRTMTVVKTLTMSRPAYKMIAEDHPGSVGKILENLLAKVEEIAAQVHPAPTLNLPTSLDILRAGSVFGQIDDDSSSKNSDILKAEAVFGMDDSNSPHNHAAEIHHAVVSVQVQSHLTRVHDLVKMHLNKQKDDHTTRFLFAASRGDTSTIALMCDQGFDPNGADYDDRTALMIAAMKGNTEAVTKLLEYEANPNLVDVHGSSALYEAARNGHETTMDELLENNAELCMNESLAASTLCQAVFDGDILTLRRLLRARIQVNASDYDKRTAVHIAAAEGNIAAIKVLVEFGADLTLKDRWNNSVEDEAKNANAGQLLVYLERLKQQERTQA